MTDRYIEIDSSQFETFLSDKGFVKSVQHHEVVFTRQHKNNPNIHIRVFTSIRAGQDQKSQDTARARGTDAIRIAAFFDNGERSFGVYKGPRVYRTGSQEKVHERTLERMREAYQRCTDWIKNNQNGKG